MNISKNTFQKSKKKKRLPKMCCIIKQETIKAQITEKKKNKLPHSWSLSVGEKVIITKSPTFSKLFLKKKSLCSFTNDICPRPTTVVYSVCTVLV